VLANGRHPRRDHRGRDVEILNILDDHSRLCVASHALTVFTAHDVVTTLHDAAARFGYPASVLSDNAAIFTAAFKGGIGAFESQLADLGITVKHSRPYHPQTCGKIERFHQTLKRYLTKQRTPRSIPGLQAQLDRFTHRYNTVRPHRALGRHTPLEAYTARTKAHPIAPTNPVDGYRLRHDTIDRDGKLTLRYAGRLRHIGMGRRHAGTPITMLVAGQDVRIIDQHTGELLRELTIDPTRDYQPQR
jgi:hypothetical protein